MSLPSICPFIDRHTYSRVWIFQHTWVIFHVRNKLVYWCLSTAYSRLITPNKCWIGSKMFKNYWQHNYLCISNWNALLSSIFKIKGTWSPTAAIHFQIFTGNSAAISKNLGVTLKWEKLRAERNLLLKTSVFIPSTPYAISFTAPRGIFLKCISGETPTLFFIS